MRNKVWCCFLLALVALAGFAVVEDGLRKSARASTVTPQPGEPILHGQGYNSLTGEFRGPCVVQQPVQNASSGQNVTLEIRQLESVRDLTRELGLSASVSARWGLGSASASFSYATGTDLNSYGLSFLVRSRVDNGTLTLSSPDLTRDAASLLRTNPARFAQACGDEFVRSIVTGGEFAAVITIETVSISDRQHVGASFRGSYLGVAGGAEFEQRLEDASRTHNMHVRVVINGSSGAVPVLNPAAIIEYAREYPNLVRNASRPWLVNTAPYSTLTTIRSSPVSYEAQQASLQGLGQRLDRAVEVRNDLLYVQSHTEQFCSPPTAEIQARLVELENYIVHIRDHARRCYEAARPESTPTVCGPFTERVPEMIEVRRRRSPPTSGQLREFDASMNAPIEIRLPPDEVCTIVQATGRWSYCSGCEMSSLCPGVTIEGRVARADFDSHYYDNSGTCKYTFRCLPEGAIGEACP